MENRCHLSSMETGLPLNLIDQILECRATPIVIAALRMVITMYPNSNFFYRPPLSQPSRNEKSIEDEFKGLKDISILL